MGIDAIAAQVNAPEKKDEASRQTLGQDDFLKLLTKQLSTQDPTNPMDNTDFIAQMAQFSTVTGISELSNSFEKLSETLSGDRVIQASSLIGHVVQANTGGGGFFDGENMVGAVMLEHPSSSVKVNIYSESGELIQEIGLDGSDGDDLYFTWDGVDMHGTQRGAGRFRVEAVANYGEESVQVPVESVNKVESVLLGGAGSGTTLLLQGIGEVNMSTVSQVF
jgi:flagellar basal-body rod modification protein FlgD